MATTTTGRCRRCEKQDRKRHVYKWKRSRKRLLRDAICPACKAPLHGTSHLLREPIVVHGEPLFTRSPGAVLGYYRKAPPIPQD